MLEHPVQPLEKDKDGIIRFKPNKIVRFLLDEGAFDINQLVLMDFEQEDWEQFAQLIGYSLSGFGDLSYVSDETYSRVENQSAINVVERLNHRITELEKEINVSDMLIEQYKSILHAIPECEVHGNGCIPHAIEWIERIKTFGEIIFKLKR